MCGKRDTEPGVELQACGACKLTRYCSRQCQKNAWPSHKPVLQMIRACMHSPSTYSLELRGGLGHRPLEGTRSFNLLWERRPQKSLFRNFWNNASASTGLNVGTICPASLTVTYANSLLLPVEGAS